MGNKTDIYTLCWGQRRGEGRGEERRGEERRGEERRGGQRRGEERSVNLIL